MMAVVAAAMVVAVVVAAGLITNYVRLCDGQNISVVSMQDIQNH